LHYLDVLRVGYGVLSFHTAAFFGGVFLSLMETAWLKLKECMGGGRFV
jgi:hypothetical protein